MVGTGTGGRPANVSHEYSLTCRFPLVDVKVAMSCPYCLLDGELNQEVVGQLFGDKRNCLRIVVWGVWS